MSGLRSLRWVRLASSSLAGLKMGRLWLPAKTATGEGVRVRLRPEGVSGVVTTPTTLIRSFFRIDSRMVAEKSGEPK